MRPSAGDCRQSAPLSPVAAGLLGPVQGRVRPSEQAVQALPEPAHSAAPRLTVTARRLPSNSATAAATAARRRSATPRASSIPVSGRSAANSSPPIRPRMSTARRVSRAVRARDASTASPAAWPMVSLTALKWSTSNMIRLVTCPNRPARPSSASPASMNRRRLKRPVRPSVVARRTSRASVRLRSLMSLAAPTAHHRPACRNPATDSSTGKTLPSPRRAVSSVMVPTTLPRPPAANSENPARALSNSPCGATASCSTRPSISSRDRPNMPSAAGFQKTTRPWSSIIARASREASLMARNFSSLAASRAWTASRRARPEAHIQDTPPITTNRATVKTTNTVPSGGRISSGATGHDHPVSSGQTGRGRLKPSPGRRP
jgi:hypothetical protein